MVDLNDEEKQKLHEIIESWDSMILGIRLINGLARFIKWLSALILAGLVVYNTFFSGKPPTFP